MGLAERTPASRARNFPATKIPSNLSAKTSSPEDPDATVVCFPSGPLPIRPAQPSDIIQKTRSTSSASHIRQLEAQEICLHPLTERSNRKPTHLRTPPASNHPPRFTGQGKRTQKIAHLPSVPPQLPRSINCSFTPSTKSAGKVIDGSTSGVPSEYIARRTASRDLSQKLWNSLFKGQDFLRAVSLQPTLYTIASAHPSSSSSNNNSHTQWPTKSSSASWSEKGNTCGPKRSSTFGSSS